MSCRSGATPARTVMVIRRWLAPSQTTAKRIAKVMLDYMRRELAIKVDALDAARQEALKQRSSQRLSGTWSIDELEKLSYSATLFPRSRAGDDQRNDVYLSPRGGFGLYLRRHGIFPLHHERLTLKETERIIAGLLEALRLYGLVEIVAPASADQPVPGYQLQAAQLRWLAGDGDRAFHDPIRVPQAPPDGRPHEPVFRRFVPLDRRRRPGNRSPRAHRPGQARAAPGAGAGVPLRQASAAVLLSDDGAGCRHRLAERREPAQCAADPGQLRAALGPRWSQRAAGAGVHVLLNLEQPRPVLLPPTRADGLWTGRAATARSRKRGPRARPCARDLAERDRRRTGELLDGDSRGRGRRPIARPS